MGGGVDTSSLPSGKCRQTISAGQDTLTPPPDKFPGDDNFRGGGLSKRKIRFPEDPDPDPPLNGTSPKLELEGGSAGSNFSPAP